MPWCSGGRLDCGPAGAESVRAQTETLVANPHAALAKGGLFSTPLKGFDTFNKSKAHDDRAKGGEPAHTYGLCPARAAECFSSCLANECP